MPPGPDVVVCLRLARERRRFGYRRLLIFLRREGFVVNHKRLFRVYREERLMVRKRGGRKRALGTRTPMPVPTLPNQLWVLDFVSDQLVCGRRFRILAIYDVCIRRWPCDKLGADRVSCRRGEAPTVDPLGILLKLEYVAKLEDFAGQSEESPKLHEPKIILQLIRDLKEALGRP
jgi:hypothetical protein